MTRTCDLQVRNLTLYPTELWAPGARRDPSETPRRKRGLFPNLGNTPGRTREKHPNRRSSPRRAAPIGVYSLPVEALAERYAARCSDVSSGLGPRPLTAIVVASLSVAGNVRAATDTDRDGMHDAFEAANGFDPLAWDENSNGKVADDVEMESEGLQSSRPACSSPEPVVGCFIARSIANRVSARGSMRGPRPLRSTGAAQPAAPAQCPRSRARSSRTSL